MKNKKQTKYIIVVENRWGFKSHTIITKEKLLDNLIFCKEKMPEIWQELPEVDILKKCLFKDLVEYYYHNDKILYISNIN